MQRNISVDACVGELLTPDVANDITIVTFHRECPIGPDWAHSPDCWCDM